MWCPETTLKLRQTETDKQIKSKTGDWKLGDYSESITVASNYVHTGKPASFR